MIFNSYLTDTPFVRTEIGIYIKDKANVWVRGLEPVGKYVLETNLEGEDIDDWLDFDKTKKKSSRFGTSKRPLTTCMRHLNFYYF